VLNSICTGSIGIVLRILTGTHDLGGRHVVCLVHVILDVDLRRPLGQVRVRHLESGLVAQVLLQHGDQAHELCSFHLLRVEIVRFGYVQVRDYVLRTLSPQNLAVQVDLVEKLVVRLLFEVVLDAHLGRGVLDHQLGRHGGHETTRKGQRRQIYVFAASVCHLSFF